MYDSDTSDCWLLPEEVQLKEKSTSIAGPLGCLDADVKATEVKAETPAERSERVLGMLAKLAKLVAEGGVHQQVSPSMMEAAQALGEDLEKASDLAGHKYETIAEMLTVATMLMDDAESEAKFLDAANMLPSRGDLTWIMSKTTDTRKDPAEVDGDKLGLNETNIPSGGCFLGFLGQCGVGRADVSFGAGTPWTNAEVHYCFDRAISSVARTAVECAIGKIRRNVPGIHFIDVGYNKPGACNTAPAIFVQSSASGCYANIGMQGGFQTLLGNQVLNLQHPVCGDCGTATHEMLHALGMAHEQSRPDREQYVSILWQNIRSGMESQFQVYAGADTSQPYDVMSIMHYSSTAFTKNGQPTLLAKSQGCRIHGLQSCKAGGRGVMSQQDVGQLFNLYGCTSRTLCAPPTQGNSVIIIIVVVVVVAVVAGLAFFCLCSSSPRNGYTRQTQ
ncbi:unnamed protein product [Effrenium voratum]|uniref:Metalloendopeptidase n=1 Tax=Effrenium voratum TaxID=2562239 RepID=A0AA36N1G1_9DINO|nr:unnamed protein product [Effrenium voratum]